MKLIRNTTKLTDEEILTQVKEMDEMFSESGLKASGETAYAIIDGKVVQGGSLYDAEIVVAH